MDRDRRLERDLLDRAKAPNAMAEQVLARLDHVEETRGNLGWERPVDELLAEMAEEAADIAGWGIGAARQLEDGQRHRLVAAISLGRAAWEEIEALREQLAAP